MGLCTYMAMVNTHAGFSFRFSLDFRPYYDPNHVQTTNIFPSTKMASIDANDLRFLSSLGGTLDDAVLMHHRGSDAQSRRLNRSKKQNFVEVRMRGTLELS